MKPNRKISRRSFLGRIGAGCRGTHEIGDRGEAPTLSRSRNRRSQDGGPLEAMQEGIEEAGLADAGVPQDGRQDGGAVGDHFIQRSTQRCQVPVAADERGVGRATVPQLDREHGCGIHPVRLALQDQRRQLPEFRTTLEEPHGGLAHDDGPGLGCGLQSSSRVEDVGGQGAGGSSRPATNAEPAAPSSIAGWAAPAFRRA